MSKFTKVYWLSYRLFFILPLILSTNLVSGADIVNEIIAKSESSSDEYAVFEKESLLVSTITNETLKEMSGYMDSADNNFSVKVLDKVSLPKLTSELKCLAEAIYFEARGENLKGQAAVGEVIINRAISKNFPDSICGVVSEGSNRLNACQFSYNCDGKLEIIEEKAVYERILKLSKILLEPSARVLTNGATFYHSKAVEPNWALSFVKTQEIGQHLFYREP
jgi:spore germination cell wall hydrolase CwlJ-like protein